MGRVVALSFTAALNPTLLAATTVMLLLPRPSRLMFGYYLGAMVTSIALGLVIVFALTGSRTEKTTENTLSPVADLVIGGLLASLALVLATGWDQGLLQRRAKRREAGKDKSAPRWQQILSRGSARSTFVAGALLTLPGASYLLGLNRLHQLHYSTATTVATVIGFNLVMLILLEGPLVAFVVAPDWTPGAIDRGKSWIGRHARSFAIYGLAVIGLLLLIKGLVGVV